MDSLPPWSLIEAMLLSLVLPALATTGLAMVVLCLLAKSPVLRTAGAAVALIAGLYVGNHCRELLEWWPKDPAEHWPVSRGWPALLPVAAAGISTGLLAAAAARLHWCAGTALRVLAAAGAAWWLTEALTPLTEQRTFLILFAGMALSLEALHFASARMPGRVGLAALTLPWGAAAAAVLIFAHSARFSDLAVLMTVSLAGVGIVAACWNVNLSALFAGPALFLPPLLLAGAANTYSEVPVSAFACAAFAPCSLWLLALPKLRTLPPWAFAGAAVIAMIVPCATAVIMSSRVESLDYGE